MKAIVMESAGKEPELKVIPIPKIKPDEVLVKVKATSICGTDAHIYFWNAWAQKRIKNFPHVLGHEFSGDVVEIGSEVHNLKIGDFISSETHIVCDKCHQCKTGNGHICEKTSIIGVDRQGCFAEYVAIPEKVAWKTDKSVDPGVASVQEPLGNAIHAVMVEEVTAKTIAIFGLGPTGLFSVAVALASGAANVIAFDLSEYRCDIARKIGAKNVFNPQNIDVNEKIQELTDGHGVEVVLEMSGSSVAIKQSIQVVKNGGRICFFGIPNNEIPIDVSEIIFKGIKIYGIIGREMYRTWYRTEGFLKSEKLNINPIITHKMPLEDFKEGMDLMKKGVCGKVILLP